MIYNIEILYEVSTVPLVKPGLLAFSYSLLSPQSQINITQQ